MVWTELTEGLKQACAKCGFDLAAPRIELAIPRDPAHGDWTTNLAMTLARPLGRPPRQIADALARAFPTDSGTFAPPEVAGPGFLNFRYTPEFLEGLPARIADAAGRFGQSDFGAGVAILVEYVSANPTGPLNVVSARAGAVGAALVRLLRATGYAAEGEFYVNDAGLQVELLGTSLAARFAERIGTPAEFPENGYRGAYLHDLAAELPEAEARAALADNDTRWFRDTALARIVAWQQHDLSDYGAEFARWFHESSLHESGAVMDALGALEARSVTYRATRPETDTSVSAEGTHDEDTGGAEATFLRTTSFGDDKDRVVQKSDGTPAYLLPDIAYHRDKRARGFRHAIDLWGPDHHGYVSRMKAAMQALGLEADFLEILIVQQVNLLAGGQPVKMSKRAGEFISLRELMDEVGADCSKFFFLLRSTGAHLDFDLDLAKRQNDENPAFYVQYAHARISALLRFAAERGLEPATGGVALAAAEEVALVRKLAAFPEVVRGAAVAREPHRIPTFLMETAAEFHRFYHACRVVGDDAGQSRGRLLLAAATRHVLHNGLELLGVSAP
ncbi:MAG: arginine--tRNA ligase, partial [Candidatus Eisenbacteria bacterium]